MAKAKSSGDESWGPFSDTYEKNGPDGFIYEQEVASYREVSTPHGVFGVQPGKVLTFEDKTVIEDGQEIVLPQAVFTDAKDLEYKEPKKTKRQVAV